MSNSIDHLAQLFDQARALHGPERAQFIQVKCQGQPDLKNRLLRMLALDESPTREGMGAELFEGAPALAWSEDDGVGSVRDKPGDPIGPYVLVRPIGQGGFGTVWLAERRDGTLTMRAAVKIVRAGMDSQRVLARFQQERQAQAIMDHPGIARVLDAGTTTHASPYFLMEYIEGEPIVAYCDRHRLSLRQRVELFAQVCDAVQHAHQKGIIHRDLKPANVLVTIIDGRPQPKVIDFGIAKAINAGLEVRPLETLRHELMGTPEYMSPEQAEPGMPDVDTRSDVYSLGAMLYELLSGAPPLDSGMLAGAGFDALRSAIREREPIKPSERLQGMTRSPGSSDQLRTLALARSSEDSQLVRVLRRELEWIPMKALRKEREQRYPTVQALGDDLRRYLAGDALQAGPESAWYRVAKFARRHKHEARLAGVFATALVAIAITSAILAARASAAERDKSAALGRTELALDQARDARDVSDAISNFQALSLGSLPAGDLGAGMRSRLGEAYSRTLERQGVTSDDAAQRRMILDEELARVDFTDLVQWVLDEGVVAPSADRALERFSDRPEVAIRIARAAGDSCLNRLRLDRAMDLRIRTLEFASKSLPADHELLFAARNDVVELLSKLDRREEAERESEVVLREATEVLGATHRETLRAKYNRANMYTLLGKTPEALPLFRQVLEASERLFGERDPLTMKTLNDLAWPVWESGSRDEAIALQRRVLTLMQEGYGPDNADTIGAMNNLAIFLQNMGDSAGAMLMYEQALASLRRVVGRENSRTAQAMANLASSYQATKRLDEARQLAREALDIGTMVLGPNHVSVLQTRNRLALILRDTGLHEDSIREFRSLLADATRELGPDHTDIPAYASNLGGSLLAAGGEHLAEAESMLRDVHRKRVATAGESNPSTLNTQRQLGLAILGQGRYAEAERELQAAMALADKALPANHPRRKQLVQAMIELYSTWDRAQPGQGHDKQAARWQQDLDATAAQPAQ